MSVDNSTVTIPNFHAVEVNALALDITRSYAHIVGGAMVKLWLSSLSFGVLTILSVTSVYFLLHQGSLCTRKNVRIPLLSTTLLFMSTATYVASLAWNQASAIRWMARAVDGLFSPSYDGHEEIARFQEVVRRQSWMETTATVMNFVIGDAIVWWRASVIWQHKAVYCIGPLLVTLTVVTQETTEFVVFLSGNAYAYATVFLSLATNIIATSLIAYKAWEHRRLVKKQFVVAGTRSQVLQALALLIESGSMYCVLMAFAVVYEIDAASSETSTSAGLAFSEVGQYITHGCIIPLAAIYPAVIIVLVAIRRSPIDNAGLSRAAQAHSLASVLAEDAAANTSALHRASSRASAQAYVEGTVEGTLAEDRPYTQPLESAMDTEGLARRGNA